MKPMVCERCGAPVVQGSAACAYCGVRFEGAAHAPSPAAQGDERVVAALRAGNIIEAIKCHREIHRTGLRESKDAVEALAAALHLCGR